MRTSLSRLGRHAPRAALTSLMLWTWASPAEAQIVFSVDYRGSSIGTPATGGGCITAADLLHQLPGPAYGPLAPPTILISGAFGPPGPGLGLALPVPMCACPPPGNVPCAREVDALSFGQDFPILPQALPAGTFVFSVDACSTAIPGPLFDVQSEFLIGDSPADVFESLMLPPLPVPPPGPALGTGNAGILDGNGLASPSGGWYPGVGLIEPRLPGPAIQGDDVDALDIVPMGAANFPVYFSLDAAFMNPCVGLPNSGSAAVYGFPPAAVLVTAMPGGPPVVYAPPAALGLDLLGANTDDLDALVLAENGVPGFQPSQGPFTWLGGATDMLLFSVRRGSAVIGRPDSLFGAPIEPGDVLMPPMPGAPSPFPAIFVPAEALGLATLRSGANIAAEVDALDTVSPPQTSVPYCYGTVMTCPCGNAGAPGNGCANSGNPAGANITATGITSLAADSVLLLGSGMPPGGPCLYFQGTAQTSVVLGDGVLCVLGALVRLGVKFNDPFGASTIPSGADPALSVMGFVPGPGVFRYYSCWYRDAAVYCTPATNNVSNGIAILWTP